MTAILALGAGFAVLALLLAVRAVQLFQRRRPLGGLGAVLGGGLLAALAGLAALVAFGTAGYRNLTHETLAATVVFEQLGPQRYLARFAFPDGSEQAIELQGDAFVVDAHILKWHPAAAALGLRTGYALDRVAGRYDEVGDEATLPRTVARLGDDARVDLFATVRRWPRLAPLVDAQYGSGTFAAMAPGARYEVRVSTSGLLLRRLAPAGGAAPDAPRRPEAGTIPPTPAPSSQEDA